MKKIFSVIAVTLTAALVFFSFQNRVVLAERFNDFIYQSPCDNPIAYRITDVDPRFNLTREEFIQSIVEASNIWNKNYNKDLFTFHPRGELEISLVFDERQQLTNEISQLDTEISQKKSTIAPKIEEYERRAAEFNEKITKLNQEIDYWNSHGGASLDEYQRLQSEQKALQEEAKNLQELAAALNQSTVQYNQKIGELNQTINSFNEQLKYRPEEGIYISQGNEKKIIIYFNVSHIELVHTLAHEFGHALEIQHIESTSSIMYPRTTQIVDLSNEDLAALNIACAKKNIIEIFRNKVEIAGNIIRTQGFGGLIDNIRISNFTNPR